CRTVAIPPVAYDGSGVHATLAVSADGAGAFFWDNQQEWALDLADPSLGSSDAPCNLLAQPDTQPHVTAAFAAFTGGFLFVRDVGGRLRAVVTSASLVPLMTFGEGGPPFDDVEHLSPCPGGYCATSATELRVYDSNGRFV